MPVLQQNPFAQQMQQRLQRTWENLSKIRFKVAIMSGKGGVGKTTVAVNLAAVLAEKMRVGLLDADIDCPNVNRFLGISERMQMHKERTIVPLEKHGIKVVSMASLQEAEDTPIMWREPLIANTLAQFLENTDWGEIDILLFDGPPGTSDVALSLMQNADLSGIVIVSMPQSVSLVDARKTANMARQLNVRVLGFVENFSGDVFGEGKVKELSKSLGENFLGAVHLNKKIAELSEKGFIGAKEDPTARKEFLEISKTLQEALLSK